MIVVGAYPSRSEAELARAALNAAGIPSVIAADNAGGFYPFMSGGARLLVDEVDAKDAAAVVSSESSASGEEPP